MQRILNALLQFRNPILYFFLLGFSIFFINGKSPFHNNKLEKYGLYFSQNLHSLSYSIKNYFNLKKINEKLLKENRKLKELELKSNSIALYPNAIKVKKRFPFKVKEANVIKNSFLSQQNYLIIDKGEAEGIKTEMAVLSENGVIGIVNAVSEHYSSVISILNQDIKVNIRLKKSNSVGSLIWKGTNPLDFEIEDVVMNVPIERGDTIITGGMSSYFPYGIFLGKIMNFESNPHSGYYTIDAKLFEDPSLVDYVYVINNIDFEEINSLQQNMSK